MYVYVLLTYDCELGDGCAKSVWVAEWVKKLLSSERSRVKILSAVQFTLVVAQSIETQYLSIKRITIILQLTSACYTYSGHPLNDH